MHKRGIPFCQNSYPEGKTILITGATSGIGRDLTLLLSKNGSKVIAHGRSQSSLDALVKSPGANEIIQVIGDLGKKEGWRALESIIVDKKPEVLVLNAGYNCRKDYASGWTDTEVFDMMQVNLISPILLARTFAGLPKMHKPRRLAMILSTSCHFARAELSLYVACKTGLMGFGKAMQQEAKKLSLRTILFYPGRTDSGFREIPNNEYMSSESVAQAIASVLSLPDDIVPYEFTFRPEIDTVI